MSWRLTFTAGTGEDRDGREIDEVTAERGLKKTRALLVETFGGFTETRAIGGWKGPHGVVVETSRVWVVLVDSQELAAGAGSVAASIAELLRQSAVLLTVEWLEAPAQLIEAPRPEPVTEEDARALH